MKTLTFKTNINCSGCVAAVKPFLDKETSIENWQVDTAHPDKTLTVSGETLEEEKIKDAVEAAGFEVK